MFFMYKLNLILGHSLHSFKLSDNFLNPLQPAVEKKKNLIWFGSHSVEDLKTSKSDIRFFVHQL